MALKFAPLNGAVAARELDTKVLILRVCVRVCVCVRVRECVAARELDTKVLILRVCARARVTVRELNTKRRLLYCNRHFLKDIK